MNFIKCIISILCFISLIMTIAGVFFLIWANDFNGFYDKIFTTSGAVFFITLAFIVNMKQPTFLKK